MKNLLNIDEIEHSVSKAIFFLNKTREVENFNSLKENDLLILASSLDGLGNVLFSCSKKDDLISEKFLEQFAGLIIVKNEIPDLSAPDNSPESRKRERININELPMISHLEKALLYFGRQPLIINILLI
ncbi:MAG: hypothetical protein LIP05_01250 [Tannerellaceae bacterium]|nr:hypothetical protein [Tannerellaceae bacterium]